MEKQIGKYKEKCSQIKNQLKLTEEQLQTFYQEDDGKEQMGKLLEK